MLSLDFDARTDDGQRAVEHAGQRHALHPFPPEGDADLADVVAACLPTMAPEAIAEMSLAQLHAVCQLAALVASESSSES